MVSEFNIKEINLVVKHFHAHKDGSLVGAAPADILFKACL
jgi:hypothetical protein